MGNKEKELLEYLKNTDEADLLNQQIQEITEDIIGTEFALNRVESIKSVEEAILKELHNLRIKRLGLEINLNTVERKILQFELTEELRD